MVIKKETLVLLTGICMALQRDFYGGYSCLTDWVCECYQVIVFICIRFCSAVALVSKSCSTVTIYIKCALP
jgi:hypothetical protein